MKARNWPINRRILAIAAIAVLVLYIHAIMSVTYQIRTLREGLVAKGQQLHKLTAKTARLIVLDRQLGDLDTHGRLDLLSATKAVLARLGLEGNSSVRPVQVDQRPGRPRRVSVEVTSNGLTTYKAIGLVQELVGMSRLIRVEGIDLSRQRRGGPLDLRLRISFLQPQSVTINKKGLYPEDTGPRHVEPKAAIRGISQDRSRTGLGSRHQ